MKRIVLWCALLFTAILAVVWPLVPLPSASHRLASLPNHNPDFQSRPLKLSSEDRAFLGQADAVQHLVTMRSGDRLVLTVIDGTQNRHAVHDPSYCFSGAGWQIQAKTTVKVPSGDATWVSLAKGHQKLEALWFFDDDQHQFTSLLEYGFKTGSRRATLGLSGAEPILVTLKSFPNEPINWDRVRQILLPALGFH